MTANLEIVDADGDTSPEASSLSPDSNTSRDKHDSPSPSQHRRKDEKWSDVRDPFERRRIQNRNAQRKFRAKAKDYRIMALLEWRNQQLAANSYRTPLGIDFGTGRELSGLPWGGVDLSVVFSRDRKADAPACCTSSPLTMPTEAFSTCCPPDDQMDAASHWSGWDDTSATVGAYVYKPTAAHDMNTSV